MSTQVFKPGALLPALWLFEVPPLIVGDQLVDDACWICAPNDTVAIAQLRRRHILRHIQVDPAARKMRLGRMGPAPQDDWGPGAKETR